MLFEFGNVLLMFMLWFLSEKNVEWFENSGRLIFEVYVYENFMLLMFKSDIFFYGKYKIDEVEQRKWEGMVLVGKILEWPKCL